MLKNWSDVIGPLKNTDFFKHACNFQHELRVKGVEVYPPEQDIFNAFRYTALQDLKVVIIGQDPYHEPGQAMGLSFSVPPHVQIPPSLLNRYKELSTDISGFEIPDHGCLIPWAKQGVLLLNAVLTVTRGQAFSHAKQGWEQFTDAVIAQINSQCEHVVFLLWGKAAADKCRNVDPAKHLILKAPHPSPLSAFRGFFGCHHFSKANVYLKANGKDEIVWQLPLHLDGDEEL